MQIIGNKKLCIFYELFMASMALIVIAIMILQEASFISIYTKGILSYIDAVILIIFVVDYFTRFFLAKSKWVFIKNNIPDLLSIIPFDSIFRAIRILKVFKLIRFAKATKLIRLGVLLSKLNKSMKRFLQTNNFIYIIWITITVIFTGALGISLVEKMTFSDALWWAFVTATTVGYGDLSPSTSAGRIIASILMLIGIGFIGMLTGTIATFFITTKKPQSYREKVIQEIKDQLDNEDITKEDINNICKILKSLHED